MHDHRDEKRDREAVRKDAFSSVLFMVSVMAVTFIIYKIVYYFVSTHYIDATFRDMLYFELGVIIFTVISFIHAVMRHN